MRKITLLTALLGVLLGTVCAQAKPVEGKLYRIKSGDKSLTIRSYNGNHTLGTNGDVPLLDQDEKNADQVWELVPVDAASNKYKLLSASGYYLKCRSWNCDAVSTDGSTIIIEEAATDGVFYLRDNDKSDKFFKVEAVSGDNNTVHPFCDGTGTQTKAEWSFVEVPETEFVKVTYNYQFSGVTKHTETKWCAVGSEHAAPAINFVTFTNPEGTITAAGTYNLACGTAPFESADSYENITTWYSAKLHSNQSHYMYWTGSAIAFTDALSAGNKAYGWAFVGNPFDGFKVYNKLAGEDVVLDDSNPCSMSAGNHIVKPYVSSAVTLANGGFCLKFDGETNYLNYNGGNIVRYSDNDAGSTWKVEEMDLSVDAAAKQAKAEALTLVNASSILFGDPATAGTPANTAKTAIEDYTYDNTSETDVTTAVEFYNNTINAMCAGVDKDIVFSNSTRNNKYMVVTEAVQMSGADAADGTSIFHVKGVSGTKQFTIQNKANGRYIANTPAASGRVQLKPEAEAGKFTIKSWGTDNKFAFICVNPTNTTHNSLHLDGSSKVVAWEANVENMASVWVIQEPASELSVEEGTTIVKNQVWNSINTLKTNMSALAFGDGLGQYSGDEDAFNTALNAIPTSIDGLDFEAVYALNTKKNALQTAYDALSINQPAGKAFTIKGKQNSKYLSTSAVTLDTSDPDDAGVNRVQMVDEADADIYVLTADNGLVSYTAGYGFKNSEKVALPGTAINTMTFQKGNSVGYYVLRSNYDGNPYLYNRDDRTMLCSNASLAGDNTDWILTEVAALPIKMNQVGEAWYATFNAPVSVEIPAGLKAYSAVVDGDVMELTKVAENGAVLAANTPVILYSEANVTALTISAEEGNTAEGNALSGTNQKITVEANTTHVLGNKDGIGFYKYSNTTMPAFKAYLAGASEAAAFNFSFNDVETAIEAIESNNSKAEIYDITGRRVQKAANGLYIVNGKKVMFK